MINFDMNKVEQATLEELDRAIELAERIHYNLIEERKYKEEEEERYRHWKANRGIRNLPIRQVMNQ